MATELEASGAVPVPQAVAWTLEACEAIAEAHAIGMAHGDVRLDNVVLARGALDPIVKVAWTSAAKAERAAREDVARDIAGLGSMLRVLTAGRTDIDSDGAATMPGELSQAVARALGQSAEGPFRNVAELARALAPFAPPDHGSARSVAFLLSRAGIVGGGNLELEIAPQSSRRPSSIAPISVAPNGPNGSNALRAQEEQARERDRASFTEEWFNRASRPSTTSEGMPPSTRRTIFTVVSLVLVAVALGGSWFLSKNGQLPHWTGSAPAEPVDTTEVTSGVAQPSEGKANTNEDTNAVAPPPVSVDSLPNAGQPAVAPPAVTQPAVTEPAAALPERPKPPLRRVEPTEPTPVVPTTSTTTLPVDEPSPAPVPVPETTPTYPSTPAPTAPAPSEAPTTPAAPIDPGS